MKMDNRDRTQENINIIKKLYLNTKPAIISSVKKIVTNASQELAVDELEQVHSTNKSLASTEEIVEQIAQELDFFIESRVKEDYTYNVNNNSDFISSKSDKDDEREQKALEELEKILKTAEKIEIKKNSISQRISSAGIAFVVSIMIVNYSILQSLSYSTDDDFLTNTIAIISLLVVIYTLYSLSEIYKEYKKEKRALNKIVRIIQEVIPYYLKDMSVLEKANFEVRLARMNISVAGSDS